VSVESTSLLASIARGDVAAFEELYDRHAPTVYAILLRLLGSADEAQQVLEETFERARTRAKLFDGESQTEEEWLISNAIAASALQNAPRGLQPVPPPAELRRRILDNIEPGETTLVDRKHRMVIGPIWFATAAIVLLALWGWRELGIRAARERIVSQDAEIRRLTEENDLVQTRSTRTITLSGDSRSTSGRILYDPAEHGATVFVHGLPPNPKGRNYQLWILRANQDKAQSAGVFEVSKTGSATITIESLPPMAEIKSIVVTLEAKGGAEQPSSSTYYLSGKP
jgi:hypothetical protein